ncbi:MAG: tetratricopeptide repeat protein [Oscillatoriales cyanobacterium SM2_2_1]|nr:tetratricopeptide repeat protein [Oscillatoriales cyanobacterium SM2_2_1]
MEVLLAQFEQQLAAQNYGAALATADALAHQFPQESQVRLAIARVYSAIGQVERAEELYRQVMREFTQPKVLAEARRGLQAIEDQEQAARQRRVQDLLAAGCDPGNGFLVLMPVAAELRARAAAKLARLFRTDMYTAKFGVPARSLKIIRTGSAALMLAFAEEFAQEGIAALAVDLGAIAQVKVVVALELHPVGLGQVRAVDRRGEGTEVTWADVTARVYGVLPTYGEVVDVDAKRQLIRREGLLDRVRICDLHVPRQKLILRFHDNSLQFAAGVGLDLPAAVTIQERWRSLMDWLAAKIPDTPIYDELPDFVDMAKGFPDLLPAEPTLGCCGSSPM